MHSAGAKYHRCSADASVAGRERGAHYVRTVLIPAADLPDRRLPNPMFAASAAHHGPGETNPDGSPRLVNGKPAWKPVQEFDDEAVRKRFQEQVLAVLRYERPELFVGEPK